MVRVIINTGTSTNFCQNSLKNKTSLYVHNGKSSRLSNGNRLSIFGVSAHNQNTVVFSILNGFPVLDFLPLPRKYYFHDCLFVYLFVSRITQILLAESS